MTTTQWLSLAYIAVYAGTASFCVTMSILNWLTWRRYKLLNALLLDICVKAFVLQHVPIWRPWCEMTGMDIHIVPGRRKQQ